MSLSQLCARSRRSWAADAPTSEDELPRLVPDRRGDHEAEGGTAVSGLALRPAQRTDQRGLPRAAKAAQPDAAAGHVREKARQLDARRGWHLIFGVVDLGQARSRRGGQRRAVRGILVVVDEGRDLPPHPLGVGGSPPRLLSLGRLVLCRLLDQHQVAWAGRWALGREREQRSRQQLPGQGEPRPAPGGLRPVGGQSRAGLPDGIVRLVPALLLRPDSGGQLAGMLEQGLPDIRRCQFVLGELWLQLRVVERTWC